MLPVCRHTMALGRRSVYYIYNFDSQTLTNFDYYLVGSGWWGAVLTLSIVPTVDWVLLGSDESDKV